MMTASTVLVFALEWVHPMHCRAGRRETQQIEHLILRPRSSDQFPPRDSIHLDEFTWNGIYYWPMILAEDVGGAGTGRGVRSGCNGSSCALPNLGDLLSPFVVVFNEVELLRGRRGRGIGLLAVTLILTLRPLHSQPLLQQLNISTVRV